MIKLTYTQEPEFIIDESYPERNVNVTIQDDDTLYTLLFEVVELAQYAGYVITKDVWDKIGEYLGYRGAFDEIASD